MSLAVCRVLQGGSRGFLGESHPASPAAGIGEFSRTYCYPRFVLAGGHDELIESQIKFSSQ